MEDKNNIEMPKAGGEAQRQEPMTSVYKNVVETTLDNWHRALGLLAGVVFILLLGVYIGKLCLFGVDPNVTIKDGTITIGGRGKVKTVVFPLSATQLWADTGIDVEKGQQLTFQVSGAINTAIHRVVNGGKYDVPPPQPWLSHPGQSTGRRPNDTYRLRGRLHPEAPYGSLLGLVCCPGTTCPVKPDTENLRAIRRDRNDPVRGMKVLIDSSKFGKPGVLTPECNGRLYLTVNENVPLEQNMYVGTLEENAKDIVSAFSHMKQGDVPRAKLYDEIVLEWLADAIEWVRPSYGESQCEGGQDESLICASDSGCPDTKKDAVCCASSKCSKETVKNIIGSITSGEEPGTAIDIASKLVPIYGNWPNTMDSDNDYYDANSDVMMCLAALRRVSDVHRWCNHIKGYPQVWYDENSGFFWVTIQFD